MATDAQIDLVIDKTHLKDVKKIHPHVVKKHPRVSMKRLKRVHSTRPKDEYPHNKMNYAYPIFSNHPYTFQIDFFRKFELCKYQIFEIYLLLIHNKNIDNHLTKTPRGFIIKSDGRILMPYLLN